jgi:hypothetical protein
MNQRRERGGSEVQSARVTPAPRQKIGPIGPQSSCSSPE